MSVECDGYDVNVFEIFESLYDDADIQAGYNYFPSKEEIDNAMVSGKVVAFEPVGSRTRHGAIALSSNRLLEHVSIEAIRSKNINIVNLGSENYFLDYSTKTMYGFDSDEEKMWDPNNDDSIAALYVDDMEESIYSED